MPGTDLIGALATDEVQAIGQFVPGLAIVERVVGEEIVYLPTTSMIFMVWGCSPRKSGQQQPRPVRPRGTRCRRARPCAGGPGSGR